MAGEARSSGRLSAIGVGLRATRRDLSTATVLVGIVILASFGLSATPRYVNAASDRALQIRATEASSLQRNVSFNRAGRIAAGATAPFSRVVTQGEQLASTLEGDLASAVEGSLYSVGSPQFTFQHVPARSERGVSRFFGFRFQENGAEYTEVVSGALPTPSATPIVSVYECADGGLRFEADAGCSESEVPLFQTAITQETADWLDVGVGDRVVLQPVIDTPLNLGLPLATLDYRLVLEVSGLVSLSDPTDEVWMGNANLHRPIVILGGLEGFTVFATGLLAPEDYDRLLEETRPSRFMYDWRLLLDYNRLDSTNIESAAADANALALKYEGAASIEAPRLRTGIEDIAADYREQRDLTVAFSSLVLVGLVGLALSVVIVLAALAAERRKHTTILIRGRGGAPWRLGVARFVEALILFVPSALIGSAIASITFDGTAPPNPALIPITTAVAFALVLVLVALPGITRSLGALMTHRPTPAKRIRRIVVEAVVIVVAAVAMILVRRRGIEGDLAAGFDPLLSSAPLLAAAAVGVILLRVAPHAARLASAFGSRARGIVGLVGFKSLARRSIPAQLPEVVMLIGVALAVFGVLLLDTVTSLQEEGSWQSVGANYRIEPLGEDSRLSRQLSLADVAGIETTADAVFLSAQVEHEGSNYGNIQFLGLDLPDYQEVGSGTPADPAIPAGMLRDLSPVDVGTESNPVPALISENWPTATPHPGDVLTLLIDHRAMVVTVEAVRAEFPGLQVGRPFAVVPREAFGLTNDGFDPDPNRRYVRAPDSVSDELGRTVDAQLRGAKVISRPAELDAIRTVPAVSTVEQITRASVLIATILAVIAVIAGFALTSRERSRDLGYLRAIGLSRRQMTWVTFTEQLPPALISTVSGVATGIGMIYLILPSFDLTPLTGTHIDRGPAVSWGQIGVVALILFGTVTLAIGIYSYLNREMDLANVLRRDSRQ